MVRFERYLFYLLLVVFPFNLGRHFVWPGAYVNGFLVDYLIPTVFISDLVIGLLLLSWFCRSLGRLNLAAERATFWLYPTMFLLLLLASVVFSENLRTSLYQFLRYVEFTLLALYLGRHLSVKVLVPGLFFFSLSFFFESLLAILQWLKQGYVFGFLPFGESLIAPRPPFALVDLNGSWRLRSYGTFPHPNVLGGYLALGLFVLLTAQRFDRLTYRQRLFYRLIFLFGLLPWGLTFSRTAWVAGLLGILALSLRRVINSLTLLLLTLLLSLAVSFSLPKFFDPDSLSVVRRLELVSASWAMFTAHPFTGVGLNNFTVQLEKYQFISGPSRFLQPVHNVYLLVLAEGGLLSALAFLLGLYRLGQFLLRNDLMNREKRLIAIALSQAFFLGFFDHYLLTHQSGLVLLSFLAGLALYLRRQLPAPVAGPR